MSDTVQVRQNNLYQNGVITVFADSTEELDRDLISFPGEEDDSYHTVQKDDELTKLAYKFYNDFVEDPGKYWWVIADANFIENPLDISEFIGQEILIPNILRLNVAQ